MNEEDKKLFAPAAIEYEDKVWYVDLSKWAGAGEDAGIYIIEPDGTRREATTKDGNLMDVLQYGMILKRY